MFKKYFGAGNKKSQARLTVLLNSILTKTVKKKKKTKKTTTLILELSMKLISAILLIQTNKITKSISLLDAIHIIQNVLKTILLEDCNFINKVNS